ncbi:MAG: hypothetical protein Q9M23_05420, partial [Mariprofundaceae bacterium]|nr:hypothetical protein [Mariprofundaceae bacterium]
MPPPDGFHETDLETVNWSVPPTARFESLIDIDICDPGKTVYRNKSLGTDAFKMVRIQRVIELGDASDEGNSEAHCWRFEGLILDHTVKVHGGQIELDQCAARKIEVHSIDTANPVFTASNCLFKNVQVARGLSRLEYCTVLDGMLSEALQASDCIFSGEVRKDHPGYGNEPPEKGCVRFSRVPTALFGGIARRHTCTDAKPLFFHDDFDELYRGSGCAVLHPATPEAIRSGAEDGGEMGAYHHRLYCLGQEAVIDKLKDYLPLGIEPVLIPDVRLSRFQQAAFINVNNHESSDSGGIV